MACAACTFVALHLVVTRVAYNRASPNYRHVVIVVHDALRIFTELVRSTSDEYFYQQEN